MDQTENQIKSLDDFTEKDVEILNHFAEYMTDDPNRRFDILWYIATHQDEA